MTSRDDAVRAAVTPLLDDLRTDLLVLPERAVVEQHLEMMHFEEKVLATPRFVQPRARQHLPHPRRAAIALLAALTTIVSCGLSAAGALPAPLQHITETIAHTFGVPHPSDPAPHGKAAADTSPTVTPRASAPSDAVKPATPPASAPAVTKTPAKHVAPVTTAPSTSTSIPLPPAEVPIAPIRPHVPSKRLTPDDPDPTPSNNSSNAPPGFPADWRTQAATAAATQLVLICPQATTPTAADCPQQFDGSDVFPLQPVQWSILNQPFDGAVVIAKTSPGNPARHIAPATAVTVYEAFQMVATYTTNEGLTRYAYSSGIGAATMKWNGSAFASVSFGPGSVAGQLLPGLKPPTLPRPNVDDPHVFGAVHTAFIACTVPQPSTDPTATCPQTTAAGEQWTLAGDPSQNATLTYDPTSGLFTIKGTYAMSSNLGNTSSGPYTAQVFFDGVQPRVLSITAG